MLEIGINTNNECGQTTDEILENIKSTGINNIMLAFKACDPEPTFIKANALKLNICYVHLTTSKLDYLWSKGKEHDDLIKNLENQISLCGKYGVNIAIIHATHGSPSYKVIEPSKFALSEFKKLIDYAKKCNVKLALENVDRTNFDHFEFLMDNFTADELGFCYDLGHHQLYCPEKDLLKKYGDRLLAVHIHDNLKDWENGFDWTRDLHLLPGDGVIDYDKFCSKLAKTNYNNVVLLEVHKETCSEPYLYSDVSPKDYLTKAKIRAEKLANMIEKYRKK